MSQDISHVSLNNTMYGVSSIPLKYPRLSQNMFLVGVSLIINSLAAPVWVNKCQTARELVMSRTSW